MIKLAGIFSISARYGKMLRRDSQATNALMEMYHDVLLFLQRVESFLRARCKLLE